MFLTFVTNGNNGNFQNSQLKGVTQLNKPGPIFFVTKLTIPADSKQSWNRTLPIMNVKDTFSNIITNTICLQFTKKTPYILKVPTAIPFNT